MNATLSVMERFADITGWVTWVHIVWFVLWLTVLALAGLVVIQSLRMQRRRSRQR